MAAPTTAEKLGAETLGTFVLVLGGCGTAVIAGDEVGSLGIALAFGLTVLTGAYAFGYVSGGHFNPAVTLGLVAARRFDLKEAWGYMAAQVAGATVAGAVLLAIASGTSGFSAKASGFATNGYGDRSPGGYSLLAVLITEVVLTAFFLYVILGTTGKRAAVGFSGVAIGLALTLIHLISIPVDNTSVNPARSLGVAWFAGGDALAQVWIFILAPIVGAVIAGLTHSLILGGDD
ncbi:MAG: aquaporin Z [Aeromicrobium sp.]